MIYGWLYRNLMKLAHRSDWHHAPMVGPLEDGATQRWCKWCGFRETYRPFYGELFERGAAPVAEEGEGDL